MAQIEQTQQHTQRQRVIAESAGQSFRPFELAMAGGFACLIIVPVALVFIDQAWNHGDGILHMLLLCILIPCYVGCLVALFFALRRKYHESTVVVAGSEVFQVKRKGRIHHLSADSIRAGLIAEPKDEPAFESYDEPGPEETRSKILQWWDRKLTPEAIANMERLNIGYVWDVIEQERLEPLGEFERRVMEKVYDGKGRGKIAQELGVSEAEVRKVLDNPAYRRKE